MTILTLAHQNIDDTDLKILNLLTQGRSNQQIANTLDRPLSTVQRRVRMIQEAGVINFKPQLDFRILGLNKGSLHVYLRDGDLYSVAEKLSKIDGVASATVNLGDSDVVLDYLFQDISEVIALTARVKHEERVERVVWSHQVYSISQPMELVQQENGRSKVDKTTARRHKSLKRM